MELYPQREPLVTKKELAELREDVMRKFRLAREDADFDGKLIDQLNNRLSGHSLALMVVSILSVAALVLAAWGVWGR